MRLAVINSTGGGISGGYRSYLTNILPRLAEDARVDALLCVSPATLRIQEWLPRNAKMQFSDCPPFRPFSSKLDRDLALILTSFVPDVVFVPAARPLSYRKAPVVTMVQNMSPLVSWKWYGILEKPRLAAQWLETFRAVRQADSVIAISDFVRQFLLKSWAVNPAKITPIYFGAPPSSVESLRPRQIPGGWGDFIFTAGSIEPYRGLEDIIKCAGHYRTKSEMPLRVVIAGSARKSMREYEVYLKKLSERAEISSDLCWAGQLTSEEMTWCYKNCLAFVMSSRVEAAPNTVLEAMACGAVSIAADNAPLPEFFAETALYYQPGDGAMLAARIKDVRSWDASRRARVTAAAAARARKFNWDVAADRTLALFEQISRPDPGTINKGQEAIFK